ncbi:cytosine permease [Streptomyces sp. PTD5-9]|uniref:cytosine permease n=1 Tax=Streptomyces sp. PTD5-9 TaxID=3120150 RepID=UPI003009C860
MRPGGPFWYRRGYNPAGVIALVSGTVTALLFVNTTVLVGPGAGAAGGLDLSALIGPLVSTVVYALLSSTRQKARP